ncbi:Ku protein [Pontibacter ruber]|uniref:Non-homologous end joining protein Ku n=1 Tax=Pontibacter ruber TaxID=1343895 RepID=A0ABW5D0K7_9BACT|nr:Ku protein [Pontibacter ruber]
MKAVWKGSLGFGLVNIPIKMYSATKARRLDFDLIDRRNHARVRNQRVNEKTGEVVPYDEIVKAYKYEGKYVELTDEDFEKVSAEKNQIVQLTAFVDEEEIDEIYFKKPYYLTPEKGNKTGYGLLRDAMRRTGKVAIASLVMRGTEDLAVIRPVGDALVLQMLRFGEEVRDVKDLELPHKVDIGGKQLDMAVELINQFSTEFDIQDYKDTYTEDLMKLIESKAKGKKKPAPKKMEVVPTKTKDLMAQLKASLEGGQPRLRAS